MTNDEYKVRYFDLRLWQEEIEQIKALPPEQRTEAYLDFLARNLGAQLALSHSLIGDIGDDRNQIDLMQREGGKWSQQQIAEIRQLITAMEAALAFLADEAQQRRDREAERKQKEEERLRLERTDRRRASRERLALLALVVLIFVFQQLRIFGWL